MRKILVDGDLVVFRSAFAAEKAHYTIRYRYTANDEMFTQQFDTSRELEDFVKLNHITDYEKERYRIVEPVEAVYRNLDGLMEQIMSATSCQTPIVYLTGRGNFRRMITPSYKANRDPTMRPRFEVEAREYLTRRYRAYTIPGIEADDSIGLEMDEESVCVSLDKDLDMLAGNHYNWVRDEFYAITPEQAHTNLYCQMLMGDTADNVFGVPGIGPVKAHKLLDAMNETAQREVVRAFYRDHGLDFDMNYYLLKILESEEELHAALEYAKTKAGISPVKAAEISVRDNGGTV